MRGTVEKYRLASECRFGRSMRRGAVEYGKDID